MLIWPNYLDATSKFEHFHTKLPISNYIPILTQYWNMVYMTNKIFTVLGAYMIDSGSCLVSLMSLLKPKLIKVSVFVKMQSYCLVLYTCVVWFSDYANEEKIAFLM